MLVLSAVALILFILVCSTVGVRLLRLARRTGERPELYCGLGFTLIGLIGYPLSMVSGQGIQTVGNVIAPAFIGGIFFLNAGIGAFFLFTHVVFRPGVAWSRHLTTVALLAVLIGSVGSTHALLTASPEAHSFDATWTWNLWLQLTTLVCFGWTCVESTACWAKARRRLRIGLADPLTTQRFLCWALFGASTSLLNAAFMAVQLAGIAPAGSALVHVSSALFGSISSAAVLFAFFPPRRYVEAVRARHDPHR